MGKLEGAELLVGELMGAYRGPPRKEMPTQEVEGKWIKLELEEENYSHYYSPFRPYEESHSYVLIRLQAGLKTVHIKWNLWPDSEGVLTLLAYTEKRVYRKPIHKQAKMELRGREIRLSVG